MKWLAFFPPPLFPRSLCLWHYIISEQWVSHWKGVYNIFPVDGKGTESIDYQTGKKNRTLNSHKMKTLEWYIFSFFHCLSLPPYCSSIPPKQEWSNYSFLLFAGEGKTGWQFAISLQLFLNTFGLSRRIQKPRRLERVQGPDVTVDCDVFMCVWVQYG